MIIGYDKCREYINKMPHPSIRFPSFIHSFEIMANEMKEDCVRRKEKETEEGKREGRMRIDN